MLTLGLMKGGASCSKHHIRPLETCKKPQKLAEEPSQAWANWHQGPSSPALVLPVARGTLGQALPLVDDKAGGVPEVFGDLTQAATVLRRHAAPLLVLVGELRAGAEAAPVEVEVAAGHAGLGVPGTAAAPQALRVAAFVLACASGTSSFARTH